MYIRGRQSEIGVQGSRHQVTSCNEPARIDVEESPENEDDAMTTTTRREMREKGGHDQGKETKERDEETFGLVTRLELSNGNHESVIASGLSKAKYNYRSRMKQHTRARAHARRADCSYLRSPRNCARYVRWRAAKSKYEIVRRYYHRQNAMSGSRSFCIFTVSGIS